MGRPFLRLLPLLHLLASPQAHKVTVLFCGDGDGKLRRAESTIREVGEENKGAMQVELIRCGERSREEPNRLWITSALVCHHLLNHSSLVILLQPDPIQSASKATFSAAAYALGFYRVPTIGANIKDTEFSQKNLYPTFLRTSPPHSDDAIVLVHLAAKLQYRQVVVIVVEGDANGDEFVARVQEQSAQLKIHVQAYIKLHIREDDEPSLAEQIVEQLAQTTSNTVLLCAKQSDAERIFWSSLQFTGAGRVWLVSEAAGRASNLPRGTLSVQLKQSMASALRDALAVTLAGVEHLDSKYGAAASQIRPPRQCAQRESGLGEDEWTSEVGMDVYRHLLTRAHLERWTGQEIQFNAKGDRTGVAYVVLNSREEGPAQEARNALQIGQMSERGELELDERAIVWPGGQRRKPLEVTLPKHLRVVLVADPPFVYALPVDEPARCAQWQAQRTQVEVDRVPVRGPWFPCSKRAPPGRQMEQFCCSGLAVELLTHLARGEANSSQSTDADTGFSFDLHLNDVYGSVLLSEEGEEETDGVPMGGRGAFKLTGVRLAEQVHRVDSEHSLLCPFLGGRRAGRGHGRHGAGGAEHQPGAGALHRLQRAVALPRDSDSGAMGTLRLSKAKTDDWWFQRPKHSPMESFMQPLKGSLWMALILAVFVVAGAIHALDLRSPFERFYAASDDPMFEREREERRVTLGESLWFVWGVLLNSGVCEKTPRSFSARVLGLVWCGFCMIMVASYTANLAAFLVLDQPARTLSGVNDPRLRNPSANFSFATVLHSNTYQYFKRHVELSTVFRKMEAHNQPNARDAIQALLNGSIGAFVWDSVRLEFESARNCELRTRGALFGRSAYGVGLQKGSPWTPHISQAILRLSENGTLEQLERKWVRSAGGHRPCVYNDLKAPTRLGLRAMRDGFVLVAAGILVGAGLSLLERRLGKRLQNKKKRQQLARRYAAHWLALARRRRRANAFLFRLSMAITSAATGGRSDKAAEKRGETVVPDLNFGRSPARVYCPRCHALVTTVPRPALGRFAVLCSLCCALFLLFPCALAPIFLTAFADYDHYCPNGRCAHRIGRFRRLGGPRFFV